MHLTAHVAFHGYTSKNSGQSTFGTYNSLGWLFPFSGFGSHNGGGLHFFNPFKWFGYSNGYYDHAQPSNAVINFVVSNTVDAGATASAINENQDNDNISNTATNTGKKRRRRRSTGSAKESIQSKPLGMIYLNQTFSFLNRGMGITNIALK